MRLSPLDLFVLHLLREAEVFNLLGSHGAWVLLVPGHHGEYGSLILLWRGCLLLRRLGDFPKDWVRLQLWVRHLDEHLKK